jgi:pectate lyase
MKNLFSRYSLRHLSALCALAFSADSMALDLNVVTLNKLSETRIDRTTYDYVFSVTVQNGAQAVNNAAQTLTASGAGTTILDGSVLLGYLASGEQITPADTIKIRHNRALPFDQSALVWSASGTLVASSSSAASSVANRVLLNEPFNIDKATLFSAAYRSISTDLSAPLFFVTGGNSGITIANNQLTLAAARFTIGNKPPRTNTSSGDTSANGDFDLSKPYRISFRVVTASGSGALQVMVDNNTTSGGNSLHGSASRIFNASANSLVAGQMIELLPTIGTANSFISLRTESSASVTIDDLVIEYLGGAVTSSAGPSSLAASSTPVSSKSSTPLMSNSSVATSINTSSSVVASVAPSSIATSQSSSSVASYNGALRPAKMEGFAAHAGVTGGQGGAVVTVTTGTQLNAALCARSTMSTPITILVNGTISHANTTAQGCNTQADVIEIKQMSNVSIIGVGTNALFEEIGIHVRDASNIILQNLHIRNVKKSGSPTSNGGDAIGMETNVNRVWIDHNHLEASGGEKDGYDSLLDMKAGVTNVTVSYNLYNDSSRAGLIGSSDSDDKNTNITFHHNWYKNIEQRTPLIRHALVHMYNNYWSNDRIDYMFHAINSRMNAKALVESNYFYNVNNPLIASDDSDVAGCWQTNDDNTVLPSIYYSRTVGNGALVIPEVVDGQLQSTCSVTVPYTVEMDHSSAVPEIVMANAGVGKITPFVNGSSSSSSPASSSAASLSSITSSSSKSSSSVVSSSVTSSAISSSISSSSSSAAYIPGDVNLSADCINLATNPHVNWRDTALQTDQEIVECLYKTLGTPVGYGENAKGGYDPNGNSKLTIITKNSNTSVEQQVLDAISGEAHNWIVFDKIQFAQPTEIGMYRLGCSNATVQSILGATEAECVNYQQWCVKNSVSESACVSTFFNTAMNKSNNPIRNPVIGSNKSIDGRGSEAHFLFSGFAIGKDSNGQPTQTATSVILTHLNFKGAGHTEDHYVDPDMIRSTGASHDIWIHKNTFDTTGDSAFDVKVGAHGITMSFNKILDVKRATLHSSSDNHTIDAQIRTTMHHNLFVTRDASYMALGNTLRRVPLIRRGTSHMVNNVFVNYRKDLLSIRVGASVLQQDNMFVVNRIHQEKADLASSLAELQTNLIRDVTGGNYRGEGNFVWFGDAACNLDETTKTGFTISSGSVANLAANYSAGSQATLNHWRFAAGQELVDYLSATAGKYGQAPFNSPLAGDKYYVLGLGKVACQ